MVPRLHSHRTATRVELRQRGSEKPAGPDQSDRKASLVYRRNEPLRRCDTGSIVLARGAVIYHTGGNLSRAPRGFQQDVEIGPRDVPRGHADLALGARYLGTFLGSFLTGHRDQQPTAWRRVSTAGSHHNGMAHAISVPSVSIPWPLGPERKPTQATKLWADETSRTSSLLHCHQTK